MLAELGLVEQRVRAVLEVLNDGATVTDVARRYGVSRTSEVLLGREFWRRLFDWELPSRPNLGLLLDRRDLPLEEWIDTTTPYWSSAPAALFDRIEEQLAEKEMPPPPEEAVEAS